MQSNENKSPLLTPDEFITEMGGAIGRNSVYGLLKAGRIRNIRVGRKIVIPRSEVQDFITREIEA